MTLLRPGPEFSLRCPKVTKVACIIKLRLMPQNLQSGLARKDFIKTCVLSETLLSLITS